MIRLWKQASPAVCACLASLLMLLSASCSSHSSNMAGLPTNLPKIQLAGTTNTPPHNMASYEYPFDSNGRYVSDWAAEGERRAGRSASATRADSSRWSSSHSSSSGKRKVASSSGGSKSKSSSGSKSKSSGGRSYTVKKGDTLSHIASRHGTSVKKIMAANGMSSDFLKIGRVLRIP